MKFVQTLLALALAGTMAAPAFAAVNWNGTANYTVAPGNQLDEEAVGPFDTYDMGAGVVLLESTDLNTFDGYYQSYVTNHELASVSVLAPKLNSTYELTIAADFNQTVTTVGSQTLINVTGGSFNLYFDSTVDRNFVADQGFTDGASILSGTIVSGLGTAVQSGSMIFGVTDITIRVDNYDTSVFEPDTITDAGGIFTLRLGSPLDASLLGSVTQVQGRAVDGGDYLFAADGNIALAVPEAETYAMMLSGLGLVGFMVSRRRRVL